MATTHTLTAGASRRHYPGSEEPILYILEQTIDTGASNMASGDTAQLLYILAGTLVREVVAIVDTAEGGTLTFDVGDGDDADGWLDGKDGNNTGVYRHAPLRGSATIDPSSLADGAGETKQITVTGAQLGDLVLVSAPYDLQDFTVTAYVQAANTVDVRIQNESTSTTDLTSGDWEVLVFSNTERYSVDGGKYYSADDTIDVLFNNAADNAVIRLRALCENFNQA